MLPSPNHNTMSIHPTPTTETVTVEDVRTYGADLIVTLSNETEARHEFPTAMICGEVWECDGSDWQIGNDETVIDMTTEELLEAVPSLMELYHHLGYVTKYNFEYMDRARPEFQTWASKHYLYAYDLNEAYRLLHRHKPGATNVDCVSSVRMQPKT